MSAGTKPPQVYRPGRNGKGPKGETLGHLESARITVRRATLDADIPGVDLARFPREWGDGYMAAGGGVAGLDGWLKVLRMRLADKPELLAEMLAALNTARMEPAEPVDDGGIAGVVSPPAFDLGISNVADFAQKAFPRDWLVRGVLVRNRPTVVGGPKKALKTSLLIELLISLAAATRFLGEFVVDRPIRTLLISGESGEATIQETIRRVARSKGVDPAELASTAFVGFTLPRLDSESQLDTLTAYIRANAIEVVIIDPLYLCLIGAGSAVDAANLFSVGPLLKRISDACLDAGATPVLVHHFRKSRENPFGPPEMEDLAFAGIQEFARQWLLIGRREAYEPGTGEHKLWVSVGGSDGQSGAWSLDVSEGTIGDDFQDRRWEPRLAGAAEARGEARAAVEAQKAEAQTRRDELKAARIEAEDRKGMVVIVDLIRRTSDLRMTAKQIRQKTGMFKGKIDRLFAKMEDMGVLVEVQIPTTSGSKTVDYMGYRLIGSVN